MWLCSGHGQAILGLVHGRKRWYLYPPSQVPPKELQWGSTWQWLSSAAAGALQHLPVEASPPFSCTQEAGEILVVSHAILPELTSLDGVSLLELTDGVPGSPSWGVRAWHSSVSSALHPSQHAAKRLALKRARPGFLSRALKELVRQVPKVWWHATLNGPTAFALGSQDTARFVSSSSRPSHSRLSDAVRCCIQRGGFIGGASNGSQCIATKARCCTNRRASSRAPRTSTA